jgi:hypothetical protein
MRIILSQKAIISFSLAVVAITCICLWFCPILNKKKIIMSIMQYPMADIIKRCQKDFKYNDEDMLILEQELKRYLILCALKKYRDPSVNMYSRDVDNLWHSFLLFTKEYARFCDKNVGHFIHHTPETNKILSAQQFQEAQKEFCNFVKKYEETFKDEIHPIWFLDRCDG